MKDLGSLDNASEFVSEDRAELNMIFHLITCLLIMVKTDDLIYSFSKKQFKDIFIAWDRALEGSWGSIFLGMILLEWFLALAMMIFTETHLPSY